MTERRGGGGGGGGEGRRQKGSVYTITFDDTHIARNYNNRLISRVRTL